MLAEFKKFLLQTNALALAIGVIIGGALGQVVHSLGSRVRAPTRSSTPQGAPRTHVSEQDAREVAEASRETEWLQPSFVRELFDGRLDLALIHPFPTPDAEEERRAAEWMAKFEVFLRERV